MKKENLIVGNFGRATAEIYTAHAYSPNFDFEEVQVIACDPMYAEHLLCEQLQLAHDDERTVFIIRGNPDDESHDVINVIPSFEIRLRRERARRQRHSLAS